MWSFDRDSPSFANICMAEWKGQHLFSLDNPFVSHIRWCGRYIDLLILVWEGTRERVSDFVHYINDNDMNLCFTSHCQTQEIHFLVIILTSDITKGVLVSPYRKESTRNNILMASSCHPSHVVKNLPIGELTWIEKELFPRRHQKHAFETCA